MPLDGLLKRYEACLMEMEYCLTTRYDILKWTGDFISKHLKWGYDYMDKTTISQFMQELDDRRYNGVIGEQHYRKMKTLGATHMTGGSNPFYEKIGYEKGSHWTFWKKGI